MINDESDRCDIDEPGLGRLVQRRSSDRDLFERHESGRSLEDFLDGILSKFDKDLGRTGILFSKTDSLSEKSSHWRIPRGRV